MIDGFRDVVKVHLYPSKSLILDVESMPGRFKTTIIMWVITYYISILDMDRCL